jgi:hypothetical protein
MSFNTTYKMFIHTKDLMLSMRRFVRWIDCSARPLNAEQLADSLIGVSSSSRRQLGGRRPCAAGFRVGHVCFGSMVLIKSAIGG